MAFDDRSLVFVCHGMVRINGTRLDRKGCGRGFRRIIVRVSEDYRLH